MVPYERDKDTWDVEGGSGVVRRYTERDGGEPVAVKRIRYGGVNSAERKAEWKDSVERKISLLTICIHLNTATFVAAHLIEEHSDCYFLVMKPSAPVTLRDLVSSIDSTGKSKYSWGNTLSVFDKCQLSFEGLIGGLAYLYDQAIFHKDVKPENVLFDGRRPFL